MDRAVIATATELFDARHYPGVVAMCTDALDGEPECLPLLLIRARAHLALRRDLEAQADLRDVIRLDPQCGLAYRLLGELAARNDEHAPAATFFREAVRLDPGDREAHDWLLIVQGSSRPAAAAQQLPATAAAAGRVSRPGRAGSEPAARLARGTNRDARGLPRVPLPAIAPRAPRPGLTPTPVLERRARGEPEGKPTPRSTLRGGISELPGFGEYLVASGILSRARLRAAEAYQRSMRVQLSTAIVTLGLVTPQRIEWAAVAHQSQLARERQGS